MTASPGPASAPTRHGVLFVHGLGNQSRSETLLDFARPLVDWLGRWYRAAKQAQPVLEIVELGFGSIDTGGAEFQPRARLRLGGPSGADGTWVLTEAWWAQSSRRPDFWRMVQRSFVYLGDAVVQLWRESGRRARRLVKAKPNSTDPGLAARLVDLANTLGAAVLYLLAGLAGYLILVPLMLLSRVPIPVLQDFVLVRLLQPLLQIQFGEFTTFLEDELQAANMRRRIARAVCWLADPHGGACDDVTIIAHSGGAMVAFGALTDSALQDADELASGWSGSVRKLITVGSALNKAWLFYPGLRRMYGPLPPHIHWLDIWTAYDSVPAGPIAPPAPDGRMIAVFQPGRRVVETQRLTPRRGPDPDADPDPGGSYWPESEQVTNRMLVLVDHGEYWSNDEQVIVRLAAEIDALYYRDSRFWRGAGSLLPDDGRTVAMKEAVRRRRVRVAWLAFWRAMLIAAALALAALATFAWRWTWPDGPVGDVLTRYLLGTAVFQPFTAPFDAVVAWLRALVQGAAALEALVDTLAALPVVLLGCIAVNLPLLFAYFAISAWWDHVDAGERQRALELMAGG